MGDVTLVTVRKCGGSQSPLAGLSESMVTTGIPVLVGTAVEVAVPDGPALDDVADAGVDEVGVDVTGVVEVVLDTAVVDVVVDATTEVSGTLRGAVSSGATCHVGVGGITTVGTTIEV